jgi:Flp pilus assembly protein TadD
MLASLRLKSENCAAIGLVLLLTSGSLATFGQTSESAEGARNQGVAAFKDGQYGDAIEAFKRALALDPDFTSARLYLGTTYATR